MTDNETFNLLTFLNWTSREEMQAESAQREAYISDAVDSLTEYVRSVGDARIDGGWNFS